MQGIYSRSIGMLALSALLAAGVHSANAAIFTVGNLCQYAQLQDAIDASGTTGPFEIHVLASYRGAPVSYSDKWIEIIGGFPTCNAAAPLPFDGSNLDALSKIDGAQNPGHPAINVSGNSRLGLNNFQLLNATHPGANGGGISYNGSGDHSYLALKNVNIYNNSAERGAGVFFRGTATSSNVMLIDDNTWIYFNTASASGGGIRLEGNVVLTAIGVQSTISYNTAAQTSSDGAGGGIQLRDSTVANVGSPGVDGYAYIDHNFARVGGGVAVQNDATLNLYSILPGQLGRIENNNAASDGGGVYVDPQGGVPHLCIAGGGINGNQASDGSAIDVTEGRSAVLVDSDERTCNAAGLPQFSPCVAGAPCNTFDLNHGIPGSSALNSALSMAGLDNESSVMIRNVAMRGNSGSGLVVLGSELEKRLENCMITNNTVSRSLVDSVFGKLTMSGCSIGGNYLEDGKPAIASSGYPIDLINSVIWEPGHTTFDLHSHNTRLFNVIATDAASFLAGDFGGLTNVSSADPQFNNAAAGDLHLQDASPAIDAAAAGLSSDLDSLPRGVDVAQGPASPNLGPYDLGAYEVQHLTHVPDDVIFADGFGDTPSR